MMNSVFLRRLSAEEVETLCRQGNRAEDWDAVRVGQGFDAGCVRGCVLAGQVVLRAMTATATVADGDVVLPEGVYNSWLRDCTVGDHCAVVNVRLLSGYVVGDHCLLFNVDEMTAALPAAGHEPQWMEPMNENGGRRILPFGGMTVGDAYLWAKYRDHATMVERLESMTRRRLETPEGRLGRVGDHCVVRGTRTLHNVAVLSDAEAPTRIVDCVVLEEGVVGYGCTVEYGCMALRFVLGEHVHLELGARLNDAVVGDNSTIARCEVGNSIIFPAHEQHHNNSFLIASAVMGQSNMAAGCTVGSNHNGRTADGEIVAGRGFWPGLCTSLKHSSSFASYCLLAKGSYPAELSVTLPFALVNNNAAENCLEVMPAYWWMYNMYALNRNVTKFAKRDKRRKRAQHIVFSPFAPDTAEEMINGRLLLKYWTEQAYMRFGAEREHVEVLAYGMERGKRQVRVLKAAQGYRAYEEMLVYYAMGVLTDEGRSMALPEPPAPGCEREREWVNLGGQLVPQREVDRLIGQIERGEVESWEQVHACYDRWWEEYPAWCRRHAYLVLCHLVQCRSLDETLWSRFMAQYGDIRRYVSEQVKKTRQKDDENLFRRMTYRNEAEMKAVLG